VRRAQPAPHPVRAAEHAAVPIRPRIRAPLRDDGRAAQAGAARPDHPGAWPDQPRRRGDGGGGRLQPVADPRPGDQRAGGEDGRAVADLRPTGRTRIV
jgi:hypothetical protein